MPFPEYKEMEEPFLCYIYFNGGNNFSVRPCDIYEPLADFFKLTTQERMQLRHDGRSEKEWHNKVQWARQRLINLGELDGSTHGIWRLTQNGLRKAKSIAHRYESLKKSNPSDRMSE